MPLAYDPCVPVSLAPGGPRTEAGRALVVSSNGFATELCCDSFRKYWAIPGRVDFYDRSREESYRECGGHEFHVEICEFAMACEVGLANPYYRDENTLTLGF